MITCCLEAGSILEDNPKHHLVAVRGNCCHPGCTRALVAPVVHLQTDHILRDDLTDWNRALRGGQEGMVRLARVRLRVLEGIGGFHDFARARVHIVVTLSRAGETIRIVQAGVEPLRRVRRRHLPGQHVAQFVMEAGRILLLVEIPVGLAPMGPATSQPVDHLACVTFPSQYRLAVGPAERCSIWSSLGNPCLAEILLRQDIHCQLGPACGDINVFQLEDR